MPALAALTEVVQTFFNVSFASSEQHVDAPPSRIERDSADLNKLLQFFSTYNPFPVKEQIMFITTGIEANESVNAHTALDVGLTLIKAVVAEKTAFGNIKFKRANRVVSLQAANTAKLNNKEVNINSNVIFQRIIVGMEGKVEELQNYFQYELALHPLSVFHN